ncbi:hypothetical protein RB195_007230 [Necator americanus]|uniref:SCP domain-containing protein n=1 Tax=Necator americanus TaxID=51031 RepID=A0ABR1BW94_NECAM
MNIALLLFVYSCTPLAAVRAASPVLVSVTGGAPQDKQVVRQVCANPPLPDDKIRSAFLTEHNNYRSSLATGNVYDEQATLPGSTSLFMMSYNCGLEQQALSVTTACNSQSTTPGVLQGKSINYGIIRDNVAAPSDKKVVQDIQKLMTQWTETSFEYNFNKTTVVYGNELAAPFARIVYHKSISLGCTITQCAPRKTAYACAYSDSPVIGEPLYSPSKKPTGCTRNSQCRKAIPGSTTTCDTSLNLCSTPLLTLNEGSTTVVSTTTTTAATAPTTTVAPSSVVTTTTTAATSTTTTVAPSENTVCPGNQVITDSVRNIFLTQFNQIRSQVARGLFVTSSGVYARRASKMIRLTYSCEAETSANNWAIQCQDRDSGTATYAETRYIFQDTTAAYDLVARTAVNNWTNEANTGRLPPQGTNPQYIYQTSLGIPNFAKMVWDSERQVGCSIARCPPFVNVVCHFTPRGGIAGSQMYKPGPSCNRCVNIRLPTCMEGLCSP